MSKRKFKFIVGGLAGCLLALVGICIVRSPQEADNDQGKLRQVVRAQRSSSRIRQIERFLPLFLITKLRLEGRRLSNEDLARDQVKALLTSGFLTNASFVVTNLPRTATNRYAAHVELACRLRKLRGLDYWSFSMYSTNRAGVTCRPCDLPRIERALQVP